jgi:hypothetical protein
LALLVVHEAIHLDMIPGRNRSKLRRAIAINEMANPMRVHERARKFPRALTLLMDAIRKAIHPSVLCTSDCSRPRRATAIDEMAELMGGQERAQMFP